MFFLTPQNIPLFKYGQAYSAHYLLQQDIIIVESSYILELSSETILKKLDAHNRHIQ